jgi:dodecin
MITMADHIYSISEIVGSSAVSVDDAIKGAIARAGKTLHNLDWFEVTNIRGHIEDNQLSHYQVTLKIGFRVDDPS